MVSMSTIRFLSKKNLRITDKIAKQTHTSYMGNVYGFTENSDL